jgi:ribosomal protein S27AE
MMYTIAYETDIYSPFDLHTDTHIWLAANFGDRTWCPRCGYARTLWTLRDQRWQCSRCHKTFTLGTDTFTNVSTNSSAERCR